MGHFEQAEKAQLSEKESLYFVNAWADFLVIGGFSIVVYLALKFLPADQPLTAMILLAGTLTWLINDPHFSMTNYRLYHSKKNIMQFPMTAIVVPVLVIGGMIASIRFPDAIAPYFVKLFILWSPYHFSGQSVGITMIYAKRSGFKIGLWERRAFSTFIFMTFITNILFYETGIGVSTEHYGIPYPIFGVPTWSVTAGKTLMVISGLAVLYFFFKHSYTHKKMLPPIVLLPAMTHLIWFWGGTELASFDELVPLFHSLQYIFIAWAIQMRDSVTRAKEKNPNVETKGKFITSTTAKWWGANILGGWILFQGIPYLFPTYQTNPLLVIGVVAAGAQIHHFFVDGVIWKLKDKKNSSPLLAHVPHLWRAEKVVA